MSYTEKKPDKNIVRNRICWCIVGMYLGILLTRLIAPEKYISNWQVYILLSSPIILFFWWKLLVRFNSLIRNKFGEEYSGDYQSSRLFDLGGGSNLSFKLITSFSILGFFLILFLLHLVSTIRL
jgi:hypothetical protein